MIARCVMGRGEKAVSFKDFPCWAKIGAALLCVAFLFNLPTNSGDVAAWVQAFGSIAAIVGAGLIARWEFRTAESVRQIDNLELKIELARACFSAANDAVVAMVHFAEKVQLRIGGGPKIGVERLEEMQFTFRALLNKNVPAPVLEHLLVIQREIAYALSEIRMLNEDENHPIDILRGAIRKSNSRPGPIKESAKELLKLLNLYIADLRAVTQKRGA